MQSSIQTPGKKDMVKMSNSPLCLTDNGAHAADNDLPFVWLEERGQEAGRLISLINTVDYIMTGKSILVDSNMPALNYTWDNLAWAN